MTQLWETGGMGRKEQLQYNLSCAQFFGLRGQAQWCAQSKLLTSLSGLRDHSDVSNLTVHNFSFKPEKPPRRAALCDSRKKKNLFCACSPQMPLQVMAGRYPLSYERGWRYGCRTPYRFTEDRGQSRTPLLGVSPPLLLHSLAQFLGLSNIYPWNSHFLVFLFGFPPEL